MIPPCENTLHRGGRGRDAKQFCNQWSKGEVLLFCINVRSVVRIKIVLVYCSNVGGERCIWWSCRGIRLDRSNINLEPTELNLGDHWSLTCLVVRLPCFLTQDTIPRPRPRHQPSRPRPRQCKTVSRLSWGKTLSRDLTSLAGARFYQISPVTYTKIVDSWMIVSTKNVFTFVQVIWKCWQRYSFWNSAYADPHHVHRQQYSSWPCDFNGTPMVHVEEIWILWYLYIMNDHNTVTWLSTVP